MRALWRVEALPLWLFWAVAARLAPERASRFGGALLARVGPRLRRSRVIRTNLQNAFPERDFEAHQAMARDVWRSLGQVLAEYPHLGEIARERVELVVAPEAKPFVDGPDPAIFVTGHFGNWEISTALALGRKPLSVVYSPQRNAVLDAMLQRRRVVFGSGFVTKQAGVFAVLEELRKGRSLGIVMDQKVDHGDPIPFFGKLTPTVTAPFALAMRHGIPVLPVRVEREGPARFKVTVHPRVDPDSSLHNLRQRSADMARRVLALFEQWIRERPDQWVCTTRRWPKQKSAQHPAPASEHASRTGVTIQQRL